MGCAVNAVVSGRIQSSMGNCHGMMMMIPQPTAIGTRIAQILFKMLSQNEENQHCVPWPCVAVRFGAVLCWSMQSHRQTIERKTETKNQNKKSRWRTRWEEATRATSHEMPYLRFLFCFFFSRFLSGIQLYGEKRNDGKPKERKNHVELTSIIHNMYIIVAINRTGNGFKIDLLLLCI